jgi:hypothetical protein
MVDLLAGHVRYAAFGDSRCRWRCMILLSVGVGSVYGNDLTTRTKSLHRANLPFRNWFEF